MWDTVAFNRHITMAGHLKVVSCIVWSGSDLIISASNDTIINVWDAMTGSCLQQFKQHAHWVNYLSLSSEWVLKTSFWDTSNMVSKLSLNEVEELTQKEKTRIAKDR